MNVVFISYMVPEILNSVDQLQPGGSDSTSGRIELISQKPKFCDYQKTLEIA